MKWGAAARFSLSTKFFCHATPLFLIGLSCHPIYSANGADLRQIESSDAKVARIRIACGLLPEDPKMIQTSCLTPVQLQAYLRGSLPEAASDEIEMHLQSCDSCSNSATQLEPNDDSLIRHLRLQPDSTVTEIRSGRYVWSVCDSCRPAADRRRTSLP